MKIWILNHYATDMYFDGTGRHHCFAKYLMRKGHEVRIFCANTVHNTDNVVDTEGGLYIEKTGLDGVNYIFVRTRPYTGNGKDRVLNMIDYYRIIKKVLDIYKNAEGRPDIVLASSVHPLSLVAGIKWGKKNSVKCICEVRDLWPESIVEFTDLTNKNIIVKLLYKLEKIIYIRADALVFTMEGGKQYIIDKKWDNRIELNKVYHINNGVDLEVFEYNERKYIYPLNEDNNNFKKFNIIYAGSIRPANNVKTLAYVAKELKKRKIDNIIITVYGDGPEKKEIDNFIKVNSLDNIYMMGRIDKKYIPNILSGANNINCLNYKYSPIFRYGGSQNKLFEYLASGRPVLANVKMGYDVIEKYDAGIIVGSDDINDWIEAIKQLSNLNDEDYMNLCKNAKRAAMDYDFKILTDKLISVINSLK